MVSAAHLETIRDDDRRTRMAPTVRGGWGGAFGRGVRHPFVRGRHRPLARWAVMLFVVCLGVTGAWASEVRVAVSGTGPNTSQITLETRIHAPQARVWELLTDYDHHAGFLPYLTQSQTVSRQGPQAVVDQEGRLTILLWTYTVHVRQEVQEEAPRHLHFQAVSGDFEILQGDWVLEAQGTETALSCQFTVKPKRRVPDWAVRLAARRYLKKMVKALATRAEERSR